MDRQHPSSQRPWNLRRTLLVVVAAAVMLSAGCLVVVQALPSELRDAPPRAVSAAVDGYARVSGLSHLQVSRAAALSGCVLVEVDDPVAGHGAVVVVTRTNTTWAYSGAIADTDFDDLYPLEDALCRTVAG